MRTKTLLLTAAIMAAGAAASMAQSNVYSLNVVGYVNVTVKPGFNIIANPLDNGSGNLLQDLIATTADSSTVYTFGGSSYASANYIDGVGWDSNPVLAPGTGFWFQNGSTANTNITFVGTVVQGTTTNSLRAGFTLVGSVAPVAKQLGYSIADGDNTTTTWHFPAADSDTVYTYANGAYASANYIGGVGWDDATGYGPTIAVAQGFFIQKAAPAQWVETFVVQ